MTPKERRILIAVILAGVALRVLHIATSLGSLDSLTWMMNIRTMEHAGFFGAYHQDPGLNHPPLSLLLARLMSMTGLEFQDAFRLLQTAADVLTTLALARLAGVYAAGAFMLSPASIFITGFHCQSDPTMVMFVVLAAAAPGAFVSGLLVACGAGVKIIALVAFPLILLRFRGREIVHYVAGAALVSAVIYVPAAIATDGVVLRNVFLYSGPGVSWGLMFLFGGVIRTYPVLRQALSLVLLASLAALWFAELRRGERTRLRTAAAVGVAILLVLVLAPGFGVQYLFWPLPFLAILLPRREALLTHGALSVFLFAMYTAWSGGWPWWFGTESAGVSGVYWAFAVWIVLAVALAVALYRLHARRAA
jgi:hypothetical protein